MSHSIQKDDYIIVGIDYNSNNYNLEKPNTVLNIKRKGYTYVKEIQKK